MYIIGIVIGLSVIPVICFIFFFRSLIKLIKCKREMKTNPDTKLKDEIRSQIIIMVVTGIIGTVFGAVVAYVTILLILLLTGAIPLM